MLERHTWGPSHTISSTEDAEKYAVHTGGYAVLRRVRTPYVRRTLQKCARTYAVPFCMAKLSTPYIRRTSQRYGRTSRDLISYPYVRRTYRCISGGSSVLEIIWGPSHTISSTEDAEKYAVHTGGYAVLRPIHTAYVRRTLKKYARMYAVPLSMAKLSTPYVRRTPQRYAGTSRDSGSYPYVRRTYGYVPGGSSVL